MTRSLDVVTFGSQEFDRDPTAGSGIRCRTRSRPWASRAPPPQVIPDRVVAGPRRQPPQPDVLGRHHRGRNHPHAVVVKPIKDLCESPDPVAKHPRPGRRGGRDPPRGEGGRVFRSSSGDKRRGSPLVGVGLDCEFAAGARLGSIVGNVRTHFRPSFRNNEVKAGNRLTG